jgi:hypothetical protein
MGFQINSIEELKELLKSTDMSIEDTDQLRDFLETIVDVVGERNPETYREELAQKERMQERELAQEQRQHEMEHTERMRALELGHALPTPEVAKANADAVTAVATAAGFIGVLVPLGMAGAAYGATALIVNSLQLEGSRGLMLFFVWGACALVSMMAIGCGLAAAGWRRPLPISTPAKPPTASPPRPNQSSTAFQDSNLNV